MCHLCHKVESLLGVDFKATRPILVALSQLHRHAEPRLGDLWLWRHEETTKLRGLLGRLHKIVPAKALEAVLDEVDEDLVHIKKNMIDHRPRHTITPRDAFGVSVTADQRSSLRMIKETRLEKERRERGRKARGEASREREISKASTSQDTPDLAGSDIHPPSVRIKQSIRTVERWMRKNNALIAKESRTDLGDRSLVSVIGGGLPAMDVGIWKLGRIGIGRDGPSGISIDPLPYQPPITQLSNCFYDAASEHIPVDKQIFDHVAKLAKRSGAKHQFPRMLSSALQQTKSKKLSRRQGIPIRQEIQPLHAMQKRKEKKDLTAGGRSLEPSPRTSIKIVMNSIHGKTTKSVRNSSVSLTVDEVDECLDNAGVELKVNMSDHLSTTSSFLSSRPSPPNAGSLTQQSTSTRKKDVERDNLLVHASSWSEDQPCQKGQRSRQSTSQEAGPMDTSPHNPSVPVPIGRPPSPPTIQDVHQPKKHWLSPQSPTALMNEYTKSNASRDVKQAPQTKKERSKDELNAKSPYVKYWLSRNYDTSDAAQNASKRRAQRRTSETNNRDLERGSADKRKELSKLPDRSRTQIFAGSLDSEHLRSRERHVVQAGQIAGRGGAENGVSIAIDKTTMPGVQEDKDSPSPRHSDRVDEQRREKTDPEHVHLNEPKISDAVKNSRRRRAHRDSTPFNDRYRNEERKKVWT